MPPAGNLADPHEMGAPAIRFAASSRAVLHAAPSSEQRSRRRASLPDRCPSSRAAQAPSVSTPIPSGESTRSMPSTAAPRRPRTRPARCWRAPGCGWPAAAPAGRPRCGSRPAARRSPPHRAADRHPGRVVEVHERGDDLADELGGLADQPQHVRIAPGHERADVGDGRLPTGLLGQPSGDAPGGRRRPRCSPRCRRRSARPGRRARRTCPMSPAAPSAPWCSTPSVGDQAAADAGADLDEQQRRLVGRQCPGLAERAQVDVVLQERRAAERAAQPRGDG